MEALPSGPNVSSFAGPRDRPRRGAQVVELEIDNRMPGAIVPGGHILHDKGVHRLTVLSSDLDGICSRAWNVNGEDILTDDGLTEQQAIDRATEEFQRRLDVELYEYVGSKPLGNGRLDVRKIREMRARVNRREELTDDEQDIWSERRRIELTTGASVEGEFHRVNLRGIKPFKSVKVVGDTKPLPEEEDALERDRKLVSIMRGDTGGSNGAEVEKLRGQVASLTATVQELMAQLKRNGGKGRG